MNVIWDFTLDNPTYSIISFPSAKLPDQYKGLVFSCWLKTLRYGNIMFKMIDSRSYYENYHRYIENILKQSKSAIKLAVLTDDFDVALGFCAHRDNILDYVYVAKDFRKQNIGSKLVPKEIDRLTHLTRAGEKFATKCYVRWTFDPFA